MKEQDAQQLLRSPEGQRLLELLSGDGGAALRQAGAAVRQGDQAGAQAILSPMLRSPEVQKLLDSLARSMNHG